MTEDYILEDDDFEEDSNRRAFRIAAGALAAVGILAVACIVVFLLLRGPSDIDEQIAAIETQNAMIAATNIAVTETLAARETLAAMPTDTPTPTNTATAVPTDTPTSTNTPVVQQAEESPTPDLLATSEFIAAVQEATPTPISALGDGTLPETGIGTWGASVAALLLIGILVTARRLRRT